MTTKLEANFLYSQVENDVIMVGFADDEYDTTEYILIQKSIVCSEQDKKLGFDKVYITYNGQERSTYGGIVKFVIRNGSVDILLDEKAASILGTEKMIQITFSQYASGILDVYNQLEKIFSSEEGILIKSY